MEAVPIDPKVLAEKLTMKCLLTDTHTTEANHRDLLVAYETSLRKSGLNSVDQGMTRGTVDRKDMIDEFSPLTLI